MGEPARGLPPSPAKSGELEHTDPRSQARRAITLSLGNCDADTGTRRVRITLGSASPSRCHRMRPCPVTECRWKGPPLPGCLGPMHGRCARADLAQNMGCQGSLGCWVALRAGKPTTQCVSTPPSLGSLGMSRRASIGRRRPVAKGPLPGPTCRLYKHHERRDCLDARRAACC